jgi:hypothetical protein
MIIGPFLIKECPHCLKPFKQWTIKTGNTFGATYWTDGRMMAPFYPDFPKLIECPNCNNLLWIDEAKKIGEEWLPSHGSEWSGVQPYLNPSESDYLAFLEAGNALDDKKVRYIRMRAWWAANDPMRRPPTRHKRKRLVLGQSLKAQDNMRLLFELLDQADERQRLLKAELARELGLFDMAEQLLSYEYSEQLRSKVVFLKDLANQRNIKVAPFPRSAHESAVIQIKIPCRLPMP